MCAAAGRTVADTVAQAVAGGAGIVQIRDKDASGAEVARMTRETVAALREAGRSITPAGPARDDGPSLDHGVSPDPDQRPIAVFIDDRLEVVRALQAEGLDIHLHVGQTDTPVPQVREVLGPDPLVGLSAQTPDEFSAAAALRDGTTGAALVDLVGVGPVHDTLTKAGAPAGIGPQRLASLAEIAAQMGLASVAIGGITAERAPALRDAPVLGICVVSAICASPDPRAAATAIRASYRGD
jgi:thiamine-phosphate diphosphorylase